MTLHEGTIRAPRKRPHIRAALDELADLGATDIRVTQNRHVRVRWRLAGLDMAIAMACAPRNMDESIQQARREIRRRVRASALH